MKLLIRKIGEHDAPLPGYQSAEAAGMDLCAAIPAARHLLPGERELIPTGYAVAIPSGYEAQVRPRSGLALHHGITVLNSPGTIDSDYRGEIGVVLINHGREPFVIEPTMRIAQLVVAPVTHLEVHEVKSLPETKRGSGGYGSTGS